MVQKAEERKENFLNSGTNQKRMSEHFAQAVLYLSIMQVAESIERVKAVRQAPSHAATAERKVSDL